MRRQPKKQVADEELEELRDAYRALGPGFPPEALRLFDSDVGASGGDWCVRVYGRRSRCLSVRELASTDLFALPSTWEVMRTEVRQLTSKRDVVTVMGFLYCRPRGTWENIRVPLLHLWTMRLGRVVRFENLLDGIELSRAHRRTRGAA